MLCGLNRTEVAIWFCDKTNVWLNLFCHCVFLLSWPEAYSIYHSVEAYELTGYTQVVIWLFYPWIGFPGDFTHTPLATVKMLDVYIIMGYTYNTDVV